MAEEKKTVVCVEDEPEMIDLVKLILGRKGFELVGAVGGREGLDTVRKLKPANEGRRRSARHPGHRRHCQSTEHRQGAGPSHRQGRRLCDQAVWPTGTIAERKQGSGDLASTVHQFAIVPLGPIPQELGVALPPCGQAAM